MSSPDTVPLWVELLVGVLLLTSALFTVAAAMGLVRLKDFFQRMHPPALVSTWAAWCVTLASIVYFTALSEKLQLHVWLIIILLSITVPVTSILLGRAALFRGRQAGNKALPNALVPRHAQLPEGTPDDGG